LRSLEVIVIFQQYMYVMLSICSCNWVVSEHETGLPISSHVT